jgi:outer membrane protein assembly factor BamB
MQRNDILPKTDEWREIAGGKSVASSFSIYYSLDRSVPFFLRRNTALSGFLSLYRQGLMRMSFDKKTVDFSVSLIPGSGSGVTLVNGYPLIIDGRPSNKVYGAGHGANSRIFFTSSGTSLSIDLSTHNVYQLSGQGTHWVIPAHGIGGKNDANAWVVTDRGRVTLVDGNMEPVAGFPVIMGLRLSSAPQAFEGKLYLCDEDGKVHTVDEKGSFTSWQTIFTASVRSPPSFLTVSKGRNNAYSLAGVYPKSFFGEIWLLNTNGNVMPNWPAPISIEDSELTFYDDLPPTLRSASGSTGIGFGSPLVFTHKDRVLVAFICQDGEFILYDENASYVSPFPLYLDGVFYLQPVFDGEYLWLVSANGTLFRVSPEGELLYQNIAGFSVKEEGNITVFDCDGDRVPEVFITGEGNALHGFTRNFRSLEGFPLPVWGKPLFIEAQDTHNGKKAEIVGIGMDQKLYRWQFR